MDINDAFLRLEIFKAAISSNVVIDDQFFPFMQQAFDWVTEGKQPDLDNQKSAFINGTTGAMA